MHEWLGIGEAEKNETIRHLVRHNPFRLWRGEESLKASVIHYSACELVLYLAHLGKGAVKVNYV